MTAFVILGVSGIGKSTVGSAAAAQLRLPFIEADDFHPPSNIEKMAASQALSEEDRMPWIDRLIEEVNRHGAQDVVISCSALTKRVRDRLRSGIVQPLQFVHLDAPVERIEQRLSDRSGHFMKTRMLASQLATFEPPAEAARIDTDRPLQAVVKVVVQLISETSAKAGTARE